MFLSKIRLRRGISPRDIIKITGMNGYRMHQVVWNLFADNPDRQRDFIYRYETVGGWPTFYTVSAREPLDSGGVWDVLPKEYKPKLRSGQHLEFTLRANPIRSRRDENGKQKRHDIVMEAKLKLKEKGDDINLPKIVQEHGYRWLEERSVVHGFSILAKTIRVDGYRQYKFFKGKGKKPIALSTLDFNGILRVTEPDIFIEKCLFSGIGPAKAFGCGLMLVRRI